YNIPFIVNNDINMLNLMHADGIRVDKDYVDIRSLRERFPNKIIGLTMSRKEQQDGGKMALVDFVAIGPIYKSLPHVEGEEPIGLDFLKTISAAYPTIKALAFGGVDTTNAKEAMDAGASGVSVISSIAQAESIKEAVDKL
ncbi:MAG TPA: thiamine phosphate synthase, partial [Bacillota bacterium]|nr:thiamine phosphate synthase [Bacillota bacterium]